MVKEDSKTFHTLMFMKEVCGGQTTQIQNANMPFSIRGAKLRLLLTVERCYKIYSSCCRNVSPLRLAVASDGRCWLFSLQCSVSSSCWTQTQTQRAEGRSEKQLLVWRASSRHCGSKDPLIKVLFFFLLQLYCHHHELRGCF